VFFTSSVQFENVGFDGANAQFQLGYEDNGAVVYAKYGYVTISLALDSSVLDDFCVCKVLRSVWPYRNRYWISINKSILSVFYFF